MLSTDFDKAIAEDFIELMNKSKPQFTEWLFFKLHQRSIEMPTKATSDELLTEVLEDMLRPRLSELCDYRKVKRNTVTLAPKQIPEIVTALKPLCMASWPTINGYLDVWRDALFSPRDYTLVAGQAFYEESAGVTFTRFLNDMDRLKGTETYERNIARIAEVYALNRIANFIPRMFQKGDAGMLKPGQTVEQREWELRQEAASSFDIKHVLAGTGLA